MPFLRSRSFKTFRQIIKNIGSIDYVYDLTHHASAEINPVKGGVAVHHCMREFIAIPSGIYFFKLLFNPHAQCYRSACWTNQCR